MNVSTLALALVAGCVGAAIWGALAYFANVEVGYVAWGIGVLVGYAAHAMGGRGATSGAICALIAILAIVGGKALMVHFTLADVLKDTDMLATVYDERLKDAEEFSKVSNQDEAIRQFMVDHEFTDATDAKQIAAEELETFTGATADSLRKFHEEHPTLAEWRESEEAQETQKLIDNAFSGQIGLFEGVKASLGPLDLLFAVLGISTAYRLGASGSGDAS